MFLALRVGGHLLGLLKPGGGHRARRGRAHGGQSKEQEASPKGQRLVKSSLVDDCGLLGGWAVERLEGMVVGWLVGG